MLQHDFFFVNNRQSTKFCYFDERAVLGSVLVIFENIFPPKRTPIQTEVED